MTTNTQTTGRQGPGHRFALAVGGLLAAALALFAPSLAQAKPSCEGKPATIVSNAAKIVGTKAPDVIVAGSGDNAIYGEGGNDTVCAGPGDDEIHGGRGDDTLDGEGGDDALDGERGSDRLNGGEGTDRLLGDSGNDTLEGGAGDHDSLNAGPGDDSLDGGAGDSDVLIGGPGNDHLDGGPGDHDIASYSGTGGAVTIDLANQQVSGAESESLAGVEDAIGGSGDDTLLGAPGSANRLDGGPGDDDLHGAGPGDEAFGGPGSDACDGFAAEESCGPSKGEAGTAVELYRSIDGSSSLVIAGNSGKDGVTVSAGGAGYTVAGDPGANPVLLGDPTSSACTRDAASDSVDCNGAVDSIQASLGAGDDSLLVTESVPAQVSTMADGGKGDDTIHGGNGDDTLYAGDDHDPDTLEGGGGDDVLYGVDIFHPRKDSGAAQMLGGDGNDLLVGGQPCDGDLFDGGPGDNDSASFSRVHNSGIAVEATIGGAVLDPDAPGCAGGHIEASTEKIEGSPGPDVLTGDNDPNTLLGRGGDDRIDGMGGFDDCVGGGGSNQIQSCEYGDSGARKPKRSHRHHHGHRRH